MYQIDFVGFLAADNMPRKGKSHRKKQQPIEDCVESVFVEIKDIHPPLLARAEANTLSALRKMLSVERHRRKSLEAVQERAQETAAAVIAKHDREAQDALDEAAILEADYEATKAAQKKRGEEIEIEKAALERLNQFYLFAKDTQVNLQAEINKHKRELEHMERETTTKVMKLQSQLDISAKSQDERLDRLNAQIEV